MLWRRRLLLFVRLNAVLQSSYDLLNNHKVSIVVQFCFFSVFSGVLATVT